jgi:F-type H+/Na+-transporting ATPase subunit alpha
MSDQLITQITADIQKQIESYHPEIGIEDIGTVVEVGDGIAQVQGLANVRSQELVMFSNGVMGVAFNLAKEQVGVMILGDYTGISEGDTVRTTGLVASVPVGDGLIGRVIDGLGRPIDGKGPIDTTETRPLERIAAGVIGRQDVDTAVQTGIKSIDAMIPIGRGQRELIIGDRQTGKTAIAIDTIINQKGKDLICIYVAIGQKKAAVARTIGTLEEHGAMDHTVVLIAAADESAAMQYFAPYAGCAIGEQFMENGRDALVVYDDLSKHAWAYRQVSLLLRRPAGREAYPGDVFYLHSRLLERAARLARHYVVVPKEFSGETANAEDAVDGKVFTGAIAVENAEAALEEKGADQYKLASVAGTGGSLTALPIIETLLGDVSAYIPTNVISITDGQIYLENNLFNAGIRPAVNVGISVSRVGGSAQTKAMRQVAGRLRMDMANYTSLAAFAQFGSDLDKATQQQLERGKRLQEILKQPQYEPLELAQQVISFFAGTNGFIDEIPVESVRSWESEMLHFFEASHSEILDEIQKTKRISDETDNKIREVLDMFNNSWVA